jgi:hypothetical protein
MTVAELLAPRKNAVVERCLRLTIETYPHEATTFLQEEKDPFVNPIGSSLRRGLKVILDGITTASELEELAPSLDAIIRIRAVQDLRPSEALVFAVHLKKAIREELQREQMTPELMNDMARLDLRIDKMALLAFDLYTKCREKISEIQLSEARAERDRLVRLVEAMGKIRTDEPVIGDR